MKRKYENKRTTLERQRQQDKFENKEEENMEKH